MAHTIKLELPSRLKTFNFTFEHVVPGPVGGKYVQVRVNNSWGSTISWLTANVVDNVQTYLI